MRRRFEAVKKAARSAVTARALRRFAHVWYVNPLDMARFPVRSGSVLPNVADAPSSMLPHANSHPAVVLMVGKFGYEPNAEAADFFVRDVLPGLRATASGTRFRLVGQSPANTAARWRAFEGVEVAGFVDDLADEYARASLVVAPVFSGGGTQIKVLEALGHACGTVVSGFAAAGFAPNLRADEHMLVARDAHQWLEHCLRLINSPAEAERLGRAGRQVVLQQYSFDGLAREVGFTIAHICKPHR